MTRTYEWDREEQLTEEGWASQNANPWLVQFLEYIQIVCSKSQEVAVEIIKRGWYGICTSRAFGAFDSEIIRE